MPRPRLANVTVTRTYRDDVDACAEALADLAVRLDAAIKAQAAEPSSDPARESAPPGLAGS